MSNANDKEGVGNDVNPDQSYAVGNKKPPLHTRFTPGKSGNPSGRPKGRSNLEATVMKEFYKTIDVKRTLQIARCTSRLGGHATSKVQVAQKKSRSKAALRLPDGWSRR